MLSTLLTIHFCSQDFPLLLGLYAQTGRLAPIAVRVQEHAGLPIRLAQVPPLHLDPEHPEDFWEVFSNCLALEGGDRGIAQLLHISWGGWGAWPGGRLGLVRPIICRRSTRAAPCAPCRLLSACA